MVSHALLALLVCIAQIAPSSCVYLMMRGRADEAAVQYSLTHMGDHDTQLLREMALAHLATGYGRRAPDEQLATLVGVALSGAHELIPLLFESLSSPSMEVQMAAVDLLSQIETDQAVDGLERALDSPFLVVRLSALYHLAQSDAPSIAPQIESLEAKVPKNLRILFPELYAMTPERESHTRLKQLLSDEAQGVRCHTVLSLANANRSEFSERLLALSHQIDPALQEACAYALGHLWTEGAAERLSELSRSTHRNVHLAACLALAQHGDEQSANHVVARALEGDPFAVAALGELEAGESVLTQLLGHPDKNIGLNAAVSLLMRGKGRSVQALLTRVFSGELEWLGLQRSIGGALRALKLNPAAKQTRQEAAWAASQSQFLKSLILEIATRLPEEDFLLLARRVLYGTDPQLIKPCVQLLESMASEGARALLRQGEQQIGSRLLRMHCLAALLRMEPSDAWKAKARSFAAQALATPVRFARESALTPKVSCDSLVADEDSQLLIEMLQALSDRSDETIDMLVEGLKTADKTNSYVLSGLLLSAV